MSDIEDDLLNSILQETPGHETDLFNRYSVRLIAFAHTRLPSRLSARLDADDIVQSVFRSFFRRNKNGEFIFDETLDLWCLLTAMTYNKVLKSVEFHGRLRRDIKREKTGQNEFTNDSSRASMQPNPEQVNMMFDFLEWLRMQLPDSSQSILQLRIEGHSIEEIADQSNLSQRTIKRVLARIRDLIRTHMEMSESETS